MSVGGLNGVLPARAVAWGRCFSVVCAELDDAEDALAVVSNHAALESLIELEALASDRAERTRCSLRDDPNGRPSGPFSSLVLDALSIAAERNGIGDVPFGGWICFLSEQDAIEAARRRWAEFLASSSEPSLSICAQTFSARVGGQFVLQDELARYLAGKGATNDPEMLADQLDVLRRAGIDGVLSSDPLLGSSAVVFRGSAVSHVRPASSFHIQRDGTIKPALPLDDPGKQVPGTLCSESSGYVSHPYRVDR